MGLFLSPELLIAGNSVRLLRDGDEAYPRMLEAIRRAENFIFLEMYIFAGDTIGQQFAKALEERAEAGLKVFVVYDALGSRLTSKSFFGRMRSKGVRVLSFNPLMRALRGLGYRRRNHRKLLLIDGKVAFLGGINIGHEYLSQAKGGGGWRDSQVEIHGPVVGHLTKVCRESGYEDRGQRMKSLFMTAEQGRRGDVPCRVLGSLKFRDRWDMSKHYLHAMRHAQKRIWIANAYFVPTARFRRELQKAAARGVDVRIIVPEHSDFPPVLYAGKRLWARYLRQGIRLFRWPGPMMHAKTAVIDGEWSTVGSYNIDHLSLLLNHEITAVMGSAAFGATMEQHFEQDFAACHEITLDEWRRRGWVSKVLENLCYQFRLLL